MLQIGGSDQIPPYTYESGFRFAIVSLIAGLIHAVGWSGIGFSLRLSRVYRSAAHVVDLTSITRNYM